MKKNVWIIKDKDFWDILALLRKIEEFYNARDEMNSAIHLEKVRLSPISIKTSEAVEILDNYIYLKSLTRKEKG